MASKSLGTLTIDLVAEIAGFVSGMDKAEREAAKRAEKITKAVKGIAGAFGTAVGSAATAGIAIAKATANAAQEIEKFSNVAGSTPEQFQRWAEGAKVAGISQEKLSDQLKDFNEKVGEFQQTGGGGMKDFFDNIAPKIGITAEAFRGLSGTEGLQLYYNSLEKAGLNQQQMSFYMESMASDLTALIPLLSNNGAALNYLADSAAEAGLIMDQDMLRSARELEASLKILEDNAAGLRNEIGAALIPQLVNVSGAISEVATDAQYGATVTEFMADSISVLAQVAIGAVGGIHTLKEAVVGYAKVAAAAWQGADWYNFNPVGGAILVAQNWDSVKEAAASAGDEIGKTAEAYGAMINNVRNGSSAASERVKEMAAAMEAARKPIERGLGIDGTDPKAEKAAKEAERARKKAAADAKREAEKLQREQERAAEEMARAQQQNIDSIAQLEEQLKQAGMGAEELARRQAELQANEYATPEQIERLKELASELYEVQKAQEVDQSFNFGIGEFDPLKGLADEYESKKEMLDEWLEYEKISQEEHQQYLAKLREEYADLEREERERKWEEESELNEFMLDAVDNFSQAATDAITGLIDGSMTAQEAMASLGQSILSHAVNALAQVGAEILANTIKDTIFTQTKQANDAVQTASELSQIATIQAASTAATTASVATQTAAATATAVAWTPAAIVSSIGSFGAAAAVGLAAVVAAMAGFREGGYTGGGGEGDIAGVVHGQEFVLNAATTRRIGVSNLERLNSGGTLATAGGSVVQNIQVAGSMDNKTATQLANRTSKQQRRASRLF